VLIRFTFQFSATLNRPIINLSRNKTVFNYKLKESLAKKVNFKDIKWVAAFVIRKTRSGRQPGNDPRRRGNQVRVRVQATRTSSGTIPSLTLSIEHRYQVIPKLS
jgi:hypothetical protein